MEGRPERTGGLLERWAAGAVGGRADGSEQKALLCPCCGAEAAELRAIRVQKLPRRLGRVPEAGGRRCRRHTTGQSLAEVPGGSKAVE